VTALSLHMRELAVILLRHRGFAPVHKKI